MDQEIDCAFVEDGDQETKVLALNCTVHQSS